jgi:hypothetical protein
MRSLPWGARARAYRITGNRPDPGRTLGGAGGSMARSSEDFRVKVNSRTARELA